MKYCLLGRVVNRFASLLKTAFSGPVQVLSCNCRGLLIALWGSSVRAAMFLSGASVGVQLGKNRSF
jgi:hypothetical protein